MSEFPSWEDKLREEVRLSFEAFSQNEANLTDATWAELADERRRLEALLEEVYSEQATRPEATRSSRAAAARKQKLPRPAPSGDR